MTQPGHYHIWSPARQRVACTDIHALFCQRLGQAINTSADELLALLYEELRKLAVQEKKHE